MSTARFAGKTAVVTGAASGIGAAIATALIAEGANVVALDIDEAGLQKKAAELGDAFVPAVADVTVEAQIEAGIATAAERFGRLDAAFNVAGGSRIGAITDLAESDWDFTVDLVQKSVFLCTKHEARLMRDAGNGGAIVNISSLDGRIPMPAGSAYATGKAGVVMFSKNAALELAQYRIRVNAVLPGLVDTPLVAPIMGYKPAKQMFLERIPLGAAATPEQVAAPCLFLASADASYITGTELVVDGGWEVSNFPNLAKLAG
ncbi:SDR family NAD(P)-dependent oxidoreductase [Nocardia huaxiensis]|uniref:SDR family oxidoreductase n=1 Tax=Nocardia huaxiensis TaxID=2755382 RepID=A0A7D6VHI9_9NOCA|nr:SDR family oxidoreductase [Nocardia huaxiensis]QLY32975.1 SDR family oxidoreductase [Nocardia huaxiensis]UFS93264.1 SDR family oxidoreductase [Nocardia huaxiensis]